MLIANYIKSAWRNILRHKLFSIINIMGLAIGLAAVMLIALYVRYETSYDNFWKNADTIYRVHMEWNLPGEDTDHNVEISGPIVKALHKDFPQIEYSTRIRDIERSFSINNENYHDIIAMVDPDFLNIFDLNVISGNAEAALNDENSIILSESFANKYFPNQNPIGQTISVVLDKLTRDFKVAATYKDVPIKSKIMARAIFRITPQDWSDTFMENWYLTGNHSYFKLRSGAEIDHINTELTSFVDRNFPPLPIGNGELKPSDIISLSTMNIKKLHLDAIGYGERTKRGDRTTVNVFSLIAVLILFIASINFMNLSSAHATQRSREVSMRKVVGAKRRQLVFQFIGESILLTLIGLFLALAIVEAVLPSINNWIGDNYALDYLSLDLFYIILLTIFVGVLGGIYPAFALSNFRPATILKANKSTENKSSITFRSILVITQFTISITLFVSTAVVYRQIQFTNDLDLGYNKENLLSIHGNSLQKLNNNGDIIKERIGQLDQVIDLTWTGNFFPGSLGSNSTSIRLENSANIISVSSKFVGYDFMKTLEIPLIAGRDYDINRNDQRPSIEAIQNGTANTGSIILNRSAVDYFGLGLPKDALGKKIYRDRSDDPSQKLEAEFQIIGVIDDVKFRSLKITVPPEIYRLNTDAKHFLNIRYSGDVHQLIDEIKQIWDQEIPDVAFYYQIAEETIINQHLREQNQMTMFAAFSGLAIFIACLGLFGLASFTAERRTKEIGIRKVFGAEVWQIVRMLVFQFSKPVLIANIIAWPIAYLAMSRWLESFVYRIDDMVIIALCLLAGLSALLIAWATVAGNSYAVARQNPIKALRYE